MVLFFKTSESSGAKLIRHKKMFLTYIKLNAVSSTLLLMEELIK